MFDVIIVGAGPAGLSAGLEAKKAGLEYVVFERATVANTIRDYEAGKLVYDHPKEVKTLGDLEFREMKKEELLEVWGEQAKHLNIVFADVVNIIEHDRHYTIETTTDKYEAKSIILAIGIQGCPRKLGVEGEEKAKYKLQEVGACDVLVVGGGDTAVEAAVGLSNTCNVTLSYRKPEFFRVKPENLDKLKCSNVNVVFESNVKKIDEDHVHLETKDGEKELSAEHVFVFAGNIEPVDFLTKIGLNVQDSKPVYDEKHEVKRNFFVAGDLTREPLIKNAINQGYSIIHEISARKKNRML